MHVKLMRSKQFTSIIIMDHVWWIAHNLSMLYFLEAFNQLTASSDTLKVIYLFNVLFYVRLFTTLAYARWWFPTLQKYCNNKCLLRKSLSTATFFPILNDCLNELLFATELFVMDILLNDGPDIHIRPNVCSLVSLGNMEHFGLENGKCQENCTTSID